LPWHLWLLGFVHEFSHPFLFKEACKNMKAIKYAVAAIATTTVMSLATPAHAVGDGVIVLDISGWQTWGAFNGSNQAPNLNSRINIDVATLAGHAAGTGMLITGVAWDLNYVSVGGSWTSEVRLRFQHTDLNPPPAPPPGYIHFFNLSFGGANAPGPNASASPMLKLQQVGLADLLLPTGVLHVQAWETFDDGGITVMDAEFGPNSTVTIQYRLFPAPGALTLLGLAGLAAGGRRRRN
jgi:hypothetical protein